MSNSAPDTIKTLMNRLFEVQTELSIHGINQNNEAGSYAEILIANALKSQRLTNGVNKGYDILSDKWGRVEVKSRRLPFDGRAETRVSIQKSKEGGFDHLAFVVFETNWSIHKALLLPYTQAWEAASMNTQRYLSLPDAKQLPDALDITGLVTEAREKL